METDFNKRVRKVLVNTSIILCVSIITYLLYSTLEKNKIISAKDKKIIIDSLTLVAKVKELKALKTAYEQLELERDSLGLSNDSLAYMVATLNEYIKTAEYRDSVNSTKLALFNTTIRKASITLKKEKKNLQQYEEHLIESTPDMAATAVASSNKKDYVILTKKPIENVEVQVEQLLLKPINRSGRPLAKDKYTTKQIKHIVAEFMIQKSPSPKSAQKIFTMKLIEPDGNIHKFSPDQDFTFINNTKIHMSAQKKVEYYGQEKKVEFIYPKATPFKAGENIIQLYSDNKLLAESSIFIKP